MHPVPHEVTPATTTSPDALHALLNIITAGVQRTASAYAAKGRAHPSLHEPYSPSLLDEELRSTTNLTIAAAEQLIAMLRHPGASLMEATGGAHMTAALGVVSGVGVAEMLREAGQQGLHVREIAKRGRVNRNKLGRLLRLLASRHIFREVTPDVFANNRISTMLDTGKIRAEFTLDPSTRYQGSKGLPALVGHFTDEGLRANALLPAHVLNESTTHSEDVTETALNSAFNSGTFWEFLSSPGNELRLRRFGPAMIGMHELQPRDNILSGGFDWRDLRKGDLVVDVGGGIGSSTIILAKALPHISFVVQDLDKVVKDGTSFFEREYPSGLASNQVKFQVHNFLTPQPIKNASVFLFRLCTHNWPDPVLRTILQHLRDAAKPSTKLVIVDNIAPYACKTTNAFPDIPGSDVAAPPYPLLPNLGVVSFLTHMIDIHMMSLFCGQTRTVGAFADIFEETGWRLREIHRGPPGGTAQLILTQRDDKLLPRL